MIGLCPSWVCPSVNFMKKEKEQFYLQKLLIDKEKEQLNVQKFYLTGPKWIYDSIPYVVYFRWRQ